LDSALEPTHRSKKLSADAVRSQSTARMAAVQTNGNLWKEYLTANHTDDKST
jgi:hypothetical protein